MQDNSFDAKLEAFRAMVEAEQADFVKERYERVQPPEVVIRPGRKYIKVDVGSSGKYMVTKEGEIFGIKAYGVIHRGHYYGTLDTIDQYYWGGYGPVKL